MNSQMKLQALVRRYMSDLITTYQWRLIEISDSEVLLKASTYAIDVVADRDGVSMVYFDESSTPPKGYNVFLYLMNKRRDLLVFTSPSQTGGSYSDFIEAQVESLTRHVSTAGRDILEGSKDWIRGYSWPAITPSGNVALLL